MAGARPGARSFGGALNHHLRPLDRSDFPVMARWRRDREMVRWWGPAADEDQLETEYGDQIDRRYSADNGPARLCIYEVDGVSVGFGESYLIDDHPQWAQRLGIHSAIGVDYAIGSPHHRRAGHGVRLIHLLIAAGFDDHPTASRVVSVPKAANTASRRALERAGLSLLEVRPLEGEYPAEGDSAIYSMSRDAWNALT